MDEEERERQKRYCQVPWSSLPAAEIVGGKVQFSEQRLSIGEARWVACWVLAMTHEENQHHYEKENKRG